MPWPPHLRFETVLVLVAAFAMTACGPKPSSEEAQKSFVVRGGSDVAKGPYAKR